MKALRLWIVLLSLLVAGCADYACGPARLSGYSCPTPSAKVLP